VNKGAIAASIVGGIFALSLILVVILWRRRRIRQRQRHELDSAIPISNEEMNIEEWYSRQGKQMILDSTAEPLPMGLNGDAVGARTGTSIPPPPRYEDTEEETRRNEANARNNVNRHISNTHSNDQSTSQQNTAEARSPRAPWLRRDSSSSLGFSEYGMPALLAGPVSTNMFAARQEGWQQQRRRRLGPQRGHQSTTSQHDIESHISEGLESYIRPPPSEAWRTDFSERTAPPPYRLPSTRVGDGDTEEEDI
jgi:hypothetical protein